MKKVLLKICPKIRRDGCLLVLGQIFWNFHYTVCAVNAQTWLDSYGKTFIYALGKTGSLAVMPFLCYNKQEIL